MKETIKCKSRFLTMRMDRDLDKIFDMMGIEREPGTNGNAVMTPAAAENITTYTNGALNKYNSFSNLGAVRFDSQLVDAVASFLTVTVENNMNEKFHKNLTLLEQNGLITMERFERHKRSVVRAKQLTGAGVYAACTRRFHWHPLSVNT